jgi:hypothetical protein
LESVNVLVARDDVTDDPVSCANNVRDHDCPSLLAKSSLANWRGTTLRFLQKCVAQAKNIRSRIVKIPRDSKEARKFKVQQRTVSPRMSKTTLFMHYSSLSALLYVHGTSQFWSLVPWWRRGRQILNHGGMASHLAIFKKNRQW